MAQRDRDMVWLWFDGQLLCMPLTEVENGPMTEDLEYWETREAALAANMEGLSEG